MELSEGQPADKLGDAPGRRRTVGGLVGVAVLLAVLALALSYLGRALLAPGPFADRAVATLRDAAVKDDVADHLTDAVTRIGGGDLVAIRPLVRSVAGGIVGSQAFAAVFRRAIVDAHAAVVQRGDGRLLITVADVGVLVQGVLERLDPAAAERIGAERFSTLFRLHPGGAVLDVVRAARRVYSAAWVLAVLAALAAAGALLLSADRRTTQRRLGIGLLCGGLALAVLVTVGREIVVQLAPTGRGAAVGAVWSAFLGGLRVQALLLAGAGAVCAGVASGQLGRAGGEAKRAGAWLLRSGGGASQAPGSGGGAGSGRTRGRDPVRARRRACSRCAARRALRLVPRGLGGGECADGGRRQTIAGRGSRQALGKTPACGARARCGRGRGGDHRRGRGR